ncbi:hypothetical protein ACGGAI_23705 [Streptomyces antibioticus]|uniref:hypothetical protein n=1 Tax=Streptomyces antibioticus TaxID=1890 RepID=UPI00371E4AD8
MDDPEVWATLGLAIRADRERQGLTREQLSERIRERGAKVGAKSIQNLEMGVVPKRGVKPPSLEPTAAALGWPPERADGILRGDAPGGVERLAQPEPREERERQRLGLLIASVYEFGQIATSLGAPADLRVEFDRAALRMLQSVGMRPSESSYGLAAYRPHAPGEGVPVDDAARIRDALDG